MRVIEGITADLDSGKLDLADGYFGSFIKEVHLDKTIIGEQDITMVSDCGGDRS